MGAARRFFKIYGLNLLAYGEQHTILGEIYRDPSLLNIKVFSTGYNLAMRLNMPPAQTAQLLQDLANTSSGAVMFGQIDMTSLVAAQADLAIPNVLPALQASVKIEDLVSFHFANVVAKRVGNTELLALEAALHNAMQQNTDDYRNYVKHNLIATKLFYAQEVVLHLKSGVNVSAEATTAIEAVKGSVTVSAEGDTTIRYNQADCPFAAMLVKPANF